MRCMADRAVPGAAGLNAYLDGLDPEVLLAAVDCHC